MRFYHDLAHISHDLSIKYMQCVARLVLNNQASFRTISEIGFYITSWQGKKHVLRTCVLYSTQWFAASPKCIRYNISK